MTAALPPTPKRKTRRLAVLLVAALLAGAVAVGGWLMVRGRLSVPTPPEAPPGLEPLVEEVVREARKAVLDSPRSGNAWGVLAETFLANELEDEGFDCAVVAEKLDSLNPRWPHFQGGVHLNRGNQEAAIGCFRRAADLDEKAQQGRGVSLLYLAETLLVLGRLDEADAALRRAQEVQPESVRVRFDRGLLAAARQDDAEARKLLLGCLDSPFTRRQARFQLAVLCQRLDDGDGARKFAQEAERLPKDAVWEDPLVARYQARAVKKRSRYRQVEELEAQGRFLEAAEAIRPLTEADPQDDLAWLTLGKLLAQSSRSDQAEEPLRRALKLAPTKVQASHYLSAHLFNQAENERRRGDVDAARSHFEESVRLARQALTIKPDYGATHLTLGLALLRLGRQKDGLAALRQAAHHNPEHGEIHYQLGIALADAGQTAEARSRLEQAIQLAPPGATWVQAAKDRLGRLDREKKTEAP
jgi:tetratricopeptide (TPR) repeat protein